MQELGSFRLESQTFLHSRGINTIVPTMGSPDQRVTLTPDQIHDLNQKLSTLRHNINNQLSLVMAAVELIRRKPEISVRMVDTIAEQPDRILQELRSFSDEFETVFGIGRS